MIIDDPIKDRADAESPWIAPNDRPLPIVVVQTRLSETDPIRHLLEK